MTWWCCSNEFGQHDRTYKNFDPTEDGLEVEIIRREMQIDAGRALHWTDADGHVLAHPMTTEEASQKGISI